VVNGWLPGTVRRIEGRVEYPPPHLPLPPSETQRVCRKQCPGFQRATEAHLPR